ncbi:MAG: hypothetical protein LBS55_05595 [Prevotellaceae bacterium]|jgi:hypothetical protein|nr:hypothetical protein [Prevotellaceae bacterium]
MKKIFTISIFTFLFSFALIAQENKIVWDYPIKPGTDEWEKCNSPNEIYQKLQIPENILKKIDTKSLVQICLDYPAPTIFYLFNTPQQGFDGFYKQFNGIRELMNRKDACHHLLNQYINMSMDNFSPLETLEEQGKFVERFYYLELFIVQPIILKSFSKEERKDLMRESLNKFDMKFSRKDLFGGFNTTATIWLMISMLHAENIWTIDATNSSKISIETGRLIDFDVTSIYQQVKSYCHE